MDTVAQVRNRAHTTHAEALRQVMKGPMPTNAKEEINETCGVFIMAFRSFLALPTSTLVGFNVAVRTPHFSTTEQALEVIRAKLDMGWSVRATPFQDYVLIDAWVRR